MAFPETTDFQSDILDGELSYTETKEGRTLVRTTLRQIPDKGPVLSTTNYKQLIKAAEAHGSIERGVGEIGAKLGDLELLSKSVTAIGNNKFSIVQTYSKDEEKEDDELTLGITNVSYGASVTAVTTDQEIAAFEIKSPIRQRLKPSTNQIVVSLDGKDAQLNQVGQVSKQEPQSVLRISFNIKTGITEFLNATGSVNLTKFFGRNPLEFLCTHFQANPLGKYDPLKTDNVYGCTYEFQHNPETWDPFVTFTDTATKKPISEEDKNFIVKKNRRVFGQTKRQLAIYRTTDFVKLFLSIKEAAKKPTEPQ